MTDWTCHPVNQLTEDLSGKSATIQPVKIKPPCPFLTSSNRIVIHSRVIVPGDVNVQSAVKNMTDNIQMLADMATREGDSDELAIWQWALQDLSSPPFGSALPTATRTLANQLVAHYPPDNWHYIMMGNSPASLLAWCQFHQLDVTHLPLGGITGKRQRTGRLQQQLLQQQDKLADYFDRMLAVALASEKPLLLVDYTVTGKSLSLALDLLNGWMAQRHQTRPLQFFGFSEKTAETLLQQFGTRHSSMPLNDRPLNDKLLNDKSLTGTLALATSPASQVFTRLCGLKAYKNALQLTAPRSLDMLDFLEKGQAALIDQSQNWQRLVDGLWQSLNSTQRHADVSGPS